MDNYKKSTFSPQKIRPFGPVYLDWISDIQASNFFFIFLALKKLLAPLRSRIGTSSVFCHSFSVSPGVCYYQIVPKLGVLRPRGDWGVQILGPFYPNNRIFSDCGIAYRGSLPYVLWVIQNSCIALKTLLMQKSPTCTYISQKPW